MKMNREEELFIVFQEECGEAVQAISKMFRFGKTEMNLSNIETEIGDLFGVFKLLIEEGYLNDQNIMDAGERKIEKMTKYMNNPPVKLK
jgi:NTP pyrophosphatase (non-canonical NTP hydrolase)